MPLCGARARVGSISAGFVLGIQSRFRNGMSRLQRGHDCCAGRTSPERQWVGAPHSKMSGMRSDGEPNSELCSPSHRVRRAKRVSCAIWSRPTRRLPKMKTGWRPISIRRSSAERMATTVPSSPRKKAQDLKRLGTTVTMRRNTAPTTLQRKFFDCASTIGDEAGRFTQCRQSA